MIASLPMYDRPELRAETDAYWAAIRDGLQEAGVEAPVALDRETDAWSQWTAPDLLFSQTCGLPFRSRLHDKVTLFATPDFGLPGCGPGEYNSVIVTRDGSVPDRPRVALNDAISQSGWGALWSWAEGSGIELGPRTLTGGHAASARAVLTGAADIAALDAQTWRQLQRFEPDLASLQEIDRTAPTPGLPYITSAGDPATLRAALHGAIDRLSPDAMRALDLVGIAEIPKEAYMALPIPPEP
ncbi:PhnD/SsuA/transferrin family substrate-binding protein [Rhodobacterales bacterium HKCCE3408]|nr:PhnD/SsuA/transferrin family substrate-binding protein [Rhodobacterales bacterium HKCCE3408]